MTIHEWSIIGTFGLLLIGLSLLDYQLAITAGIGVAAIIVIQHPEFLGIK